MSITSEFWSSADDPVWIEIGEVTNAADSPLIPQTVTLSIRDRQGVPVAEGAQVQEAPEIPAGEDKAGHVPTDEDADGTMADRLAVMAYGPS